MTNLDCCSEDELLAVAFDGVAAEGVERHLATCTACQTRVGALRTEIKSLRTVPLPPPGSALPATPAVIDRYLVVGEMPGGSQGRIFRAVHPTLEKEVLIKLGRCGAAEPDLRQLLVAEGKHLARLDHPNLVRVYDLGFHDGAPFIVLEYVRGQTLAQRAAAGRLSPVEAAALLAPIALALEVVHQAGLVHQDVKPENILLDAAGRPRLIDFGLARFRHAWGDGGDQVHGGTPAFMPPEQARQQAEAIGPRSDVFALGAVLYFLLTGKPPFAAPDVALALDRSRRCDLDRGALAACGAPRALRELCLRALSADPEQRPAGAARMAAELHRIASGPGLRRRRLLIAAGLLALAGVGWWAWPPPAPPRPPRLALEIHIERDGAYLPLAAEAAPLRSRTDRLQVVGRVPRGWGARLYHLNVVGAVRRLPVERSEADDFARLVYPGGGAQAALDSLEGGTELLLLCASPDGDGLDGLEALIARAVRDLPELPARTLVRLDRDEPRREAARASPMGPAAADPVATVEQRLDGLRQRLRDRVGLFQGVAFPRR